MLPYKKVVSKSFGAFKDKRNYLTALIIAVPMIFYTIVSSILLSDFNTQITNIFNSFLDLLNDPQSVITSTTINVLISSIIDVVIENLHLIIIDIIISLVASFITLLLTYVVYYMAYKIINKQQTDAKILFSGLFGGVCLTLLYLVKLFLWGLLFIIPAIVKSYSYSLCFLIKVENPEMKASECIKKSCALMKGRRERLFIQYLFYTLFIIVAGFVVGNITMIFALMPGAGTVITGLISNYVTGITTLFWAYNVTVYYEEVKEDEKYLSLHPELREKGITGVMRNEKPRIRIVYGPYNTMGDPYNNQERRFNDPYQNNPFKNNNNSAPKNDDPFED
ncbi:MAG: hypothetical protein E7353_05155 [Clostridiales bacterium]|nr:hypothetical protein [Clostridiales bacterium]